MSWCQRAETLFQLKKNRYAKWYLSYGSHKLIFFTGSLPAHSSMRALSNISTLIYPRNTKLNSVPYNVTPSVYLSYSSTVLGLHHRLVKSLSTILLHTKCSHVLYLAYIYIAKLYYIVLNMYGIGNLATRTTASDPVSTRHWPMAHHTGDRFIRVWDGYKTRDPNLTRWCAR